MPVNPVGARSLRVQGPRGKRALRFPQDRQDSPAAFFLRFGSREMIDVTIPPQYRARVKQRLKVLKYVEDHGVRPAARHFALSRVTVRAWRSRVPEQHSPVRSAADHPTVGGDRPRRHRAVVADKLDRVRAWQRSTAVPISYRRLCCARARIIPSPIASSCFRSRPS